MCLALPDDSVLTDCGSAKQCISLKANDEGFGYTRDKYSTHLKVFVQQETHSRVLSALLIFSSIDLSQHLFKCLRDHLRAFQMLVKH